MKVELSDVMREVVSVGTLRASGDQWKVVNAIINCRTPALGGHLFRCKDCGGEHPRYNSCRNRHCPKCQGGATAKWLEKRANELLPVPYFHVVFTIPHELNGIVLQNKKTLYDILFRAVSETLKETAKRRYGGEIGFFGVLHTWGQKLEAHPHIHCVIPGLILKKDHSIEQTPNTYFLPQKVLSLVFRAIFCRLLKQCHSKLILLGEQQYLEDSRSFNRFLQKLKQKNWIVYPKKPFARPENVLKYLARYTHRVAISNSRILGFKNGRVTFSYKDYTSEGKRRVMTLSADDFIRRFLLHVLPKGFVRIRHFGFMANAKRAKSLQKLRTILSQTKSSISQPESSRCSVCGSHRLEPLRKIPRKLLPFLTPKKRRKLPKRKDLPLVA